MSQRPARCLATALGFALALSPNAHGMAPGESPNLAPAFERIEAQHLREPGRGTQGRIGVYALCGSREQGHRSDERFAYCSSFKWILAAAMLRAADEGRMDLNRPVSFTEKDLILNSPITGARLQKGGRAEMSVADLCAATLTTSDNTAANLLESLIGGPSGLQRFVRVLGDVTTRFDRMEPELNSNRPGDPRDTTTPSAMARLLKTLLETETLSAASRHRLTTWMKGATTGAQRLQAGLPSGWSLAHKTGTGANGAVNDVGVLFPPSGDPIYLCVFTDGGPSNLPGHEAAIAEATRVVVNALGAEPKDDEATHDSQRPGFQP